MICPKTRSLILCQGVNPTQIMKTRKSGKNDAKIIRPLQNKKQELGETLIYILFDKEGNWAQTEYVSGKKKGNSAFKTGEPLK